MTAALVCLLLAGPSTDRGAPYPRIANCYSVQLTPFSTPGDIQEIARTDLLIGGVWADWSNPEQRRRLADNIRQVRRINPHVIILDFSSSAPYADPKDASFPASGWLLQPDGKQIVGWPGTVMTNLLKPAVIDYLVARSVRSVTEYGYDGTFIDCMGSGFDWWACNIEHGEAFQIDADGDGKADGRTWLDAQWVKAKTELARRVREAIGPAKVFMTNQAGDWGKPTMNGILLEDYLDYVLQGSMGWDQVLRDYFGWCERGRAPNVTTIVSSSGLEPPYDAWRSMSATERERLLERGRGLLQRMRFGLATTLMGDGYFAYDLHTRWRGQRWWYPEYDVPLGYPRGKARGAADGTWRRTFDGGTVVVNPTALDATVSFRSLHRDASTGKTARQFIVPPQDGRIFTPASGAESAGSEPDPTPAFTLSGPDGVTVRGSMALARVAGVGLVFDDRGRITGAAGTQGRPLAGLSAFIVRHPWRDFAYESPVCERVSPTELRFTGRRSDGDMALKYVQTVHVAEKRIDVSWQWTAETDCRFVMFRTQLDLPTAEYGGGVARAPESVRLPKDRSGAPVLVASARELGARPARGRPVALKANADGALVDERHYGVAAFRYGLSAPKLTVAAGETWTLRLTIDVSGR